MAVSISITCVLLAVFRVILRDWKSAGLVVGFVLLLFFSYGHVLERVSVLGYPEYSKNRYFIVLWPVIFVAGALLIVRFNAHLTRLTNPLNAMALILILFTLPPALGHLTSSAAESSEPGTRGVVSGHSTSIPAGVLPDIYYITAEGYSSARTFQHALDYDNSPFIEYLKRKGFFVASESNSNYDHTSASLASSLNMEFLANVNDAEGRLDRDLSQIIRDSKAVRFARNNGYRIVYLSDRFPVGSKQQGDIYYGCGARRLGVNVEGFVDALLMTTALNPILVNFAILEPSYYDLRVCDFFQLAKSKEIVGPKLVIVHLRIPGYPFVIRPGGEIITSQDSYSDYRESFLNQTTWTNKRFEELLDNLLSDPEYSPVIVIQGDHGEGIGAAGLDNEEDQLRATHGILNAYYFPDDGTPHLLYPSISPINTFRIIFNRYLGANLELLEDRSYHRDQRLPDASFTYKDVTDALKPTGLGK